MYVCAHTCRHTPFISLDRNTAIRNTSFFTASVAAIWIWVDRRENGKGMGTPFLCLGPAGEEGESAHSFSLLSKDLVAQEQFTQLSICTEQGM